MRLRFRPENGNGRAATFPARSGWMRGGDAAPARATEESFVRRVAIVAPGPRRVGGQNAQAASLAAALAADGNAVSFVPIDPDFPRGLGWLRRIPVARTVVNEALYLMGLARTLRHAEVAHVFSAAHVSYLLAALPALAAARLMGRRSILNYHSGEAATHFRRWGSVVPWTMRLADAIVVPSVFLQEAFAHRGLDARVIPNMIDLDRFRFRDRHPLHPRLIATRSLEPMYCVDAVIEAFAILKRSFPGATLVIAGEGSQEKRLRRLARALACREITFEGRMTPEAMGDLLDRADIFVNASIVDNQPLSILEAFAAGTPVVSTGPGDVPAMLGAHPGHGPVRGERGVLVKDLDPRALAAGIASLLEDQEGARTMALKARIAVEQRTWTGVREQWLSAYRGGPR